MNENIAIWFVDDDGRTTYDMYLSEEAAALGAAGYEQAIGPGAILGVQYDDGHAVPAAQWSALDEGRRRQRKFEALRNQPRPPEPVNTVRDPFTGKQVEVTCGDPAWLGAPRDETA